MSYVDGIDVSQNQGEMNWDIARPLIQFAILRASHGKSKDTQFDRNVSECDRLNIPWGAYHYATPGAGLTWQVQADFFLSLIPNRPKLNVWLDAEDSGGLDKSALEGWYSKWVKRVEGNGLPAGVYCRKTYWDQYMPLTNWAKFKALWTAHWTTQLPPSAPWIPNDWKPKENPDKYPWTFWQWSSKPNGLGKKYGAGPGGSADIDLNRFNGDETTFNMLFGTHVLPLPTPEPPPPPPSVGEYQVIANSWANLRSSAENLGAANDIGNLVKGSTFKPVGASGDWYEIHGYVAKSTVKKIG